MSGAAYRFRIYSIYNDTNQRKDGYFEEYTLNISNQLEIGSDHEKQIPALEIRLSVCKKTAGDGGSIMKIWFLKTKLLVKDQSNLIHSFSTPRGYTSAAG